MLNAFKVGYIVCVCVCVRSACETTTECANVLHTYIWKRYNNDHHRQFSFFLYSSAYAHFLSIFKTLKKCVFNSVSFTLTCVPLEKIIYELHVHFLPTIFSVTMMTSALLHIVIKK